MGSFGERLRREREMRGITIEEIAEATKIGSRNLRALEDEHFGLLPGGIFNKGFVRAYSKYLGLDEEQAVADYIAAETSFREASSGELDVPVQSDRGGSKAVPITIALLLVLAAGSFAGWRYIKKKAMEVADRQASTLPAQPKNPAAPPPGSAQAAAPPNASVPSAAVPAPDPNATPAATSSAVAAPSVATNAALESVPADGFVVLVKARQDSWVSAQADGKSVLAETLKAANEKTLRARDRIVLTLGNAGGVQVSYNGKDLNLGNVSGQVRTLVFTAQGLQPDAPEQRQ